MAVSAKKKGEKKGKSLLERAKKTFSKQRRGEERKRKNSVKTP